MPKTSPPSPMTRFAHSSPFFLFLAVLTPLMTWKGILSGEFIHDDIEFIALHPALNAVSGWAETLAFHFQPTKPLLTWLLAVSHWLGGGSLWMHRMINLTLHTGVVVCVTHLMLREREFNYPHLPLWYFGLVGPLYSMLPIHSETLMVTQFRGEILATFFACLGLVAMDFDKLNTIKGRRFIFLLLCWMGAATSKEIFLVLTPALYFFFLPKPITPRPHQWMGLVSTGVFLIAVIIRGYLLDAQGEYTYRGNVGAGVLPWEQHWKLAVEAFIEGGIKVTTGYGLSLIRLLDRAYYEVKYSAFQLASVLVLFPILFIILIRRSPEVVKKWLLGGSLGIAFYLLIPNRNMGSEHYWYFSSLAFAVILLFSLSQIPPRCSFVSHRHVFFGLLVYLGFLQVQSHRRVHTLLSRKNLAFYQLEHHPLLPKPWLQVANLIMDLHPRFLPQSKKYIDKAQSIHPHLIQNHTALFVYWAKLNQKEQVYPHYQKIMSSSLAPKIKAKYAFDWGRIEQSQNLCTEAKKAFLRAVELDGTNAMYLLRLKELQALMATKPSSCQKI